MSRSRCARCGGRPGGRWVLGTLDEMLDEVIAWIDEAVKNGTI
jgi:hypothetical protein